MGKRTESERKKKKRRRGGGMKGEERERGQETIKIKVET